MKLQLLAFALQSEQSAFSPSSGNGAFDPIAASNEPKKFAVGEAASDNRA
jgi:hypothetical protein